MAKNYIHENAANLAGDARSILSLYRALIDLRKNASELVSGNYVSIATTGDLLAYRREHDGKALLVVLNLGSNPCSIRPDTIGYHGEVLLSTHLDRKGEILSDSLNMRGDEGLIIRLG